MSVTFGFYNSVNGDRRYDAVQMSSLFDGIINDGVFMSIGSKLMVTANTGMSVVVGTGRAWFNHTWTNVDAPFALTLDPSEVLLNRIDAVVLEVNSLSEVRANSIKIVKGTPSSNPVAPTMIDTTGQHQHALAYISVPALATTVVQGNITNKVGTATCPFITGVLETMDIDALIVQWENQWDAWVAATQQADAAWTANKHAEFETWKSNEQTAFTSWFNAMQGQLTTDAAGNLQTQLNDMNMIHNMGGMY